MGRYLLDTNICVGFLTGRAPELRQRLTPLPASRVLLCSVVKAELLYGARHSQHVDENLQRLDELFELFDSLPFDDEAARLYGVLRAQLQASGQLIGGNDMMIAATALAADVTLVTRNQKEFRRVAGLRLQVW